MRADIERRTITHEFVVRSDSGKIVIEGYAAVFNKRSQNLGGFVEVIAPGAFTKTIQEADVRALINHNPNLVLGRSRAGNGTLRLAEDNTGLAYEIDMPDTSYARDLAESMQRGDITQSSFAFRAIKDEWGFTEDDFPLVTLREVALQDVSPVTYPAYLDTEAGLGKRALARLAQTRGLPTVDETNLVAVLRGETEPDADCNGSHSILVVNPPDQDAAIVALRARMIDL